MRMYLGGNHDTDPHVSSPNVHSQLSLSSSPPSGGKSQLAPSGGDSHGLHHNSKADFCALSQKGGESGVTTTNGGGTGWILMASGRSPIHYFCPEEKAGVDSSSLKARLCPGRNLLRSSPWSPPHKTREKRAGWKTGGMKGLGGDFHLFDDKKGSQGNWVKLLLVGEHIVSCQKEVKDKSQSTRLENVTR